MCAHKNAGTQLEKVQIFLYVSSCFNKIKWFEIIVVSDVYKNTQRIFFYDVQNV